MGKKRKVLTQEEIWDDSALIESWDEALAEYNLYHSIHARGQRVEDVLHAAQNEEELMKNDRASSADDPSIPSNNKSQDESLEDGELEGAEAFNPTVPNLGNASYTTPSTQPPTLTEPSVTATAGPGPGISPNPQQMISASSQDEAVKNLMLSWYWAGYYTGLYEGQESPSPSASRSAVASAEQSMQGQR